MEELRHLAALDLEGAGYTDPPEIAIESRLKTLAGERRLLLPDTLDREDATSGTSTDFSPGLALVQDFCQEQAHKAEHRDQAKRRGHIVPQSDGKIPYYFAPVPDEYVDHFARYLPPSAGLIVWILYRYAKMDMQTWVSQDTLFEKAGVCENTLKRDIGLLIKCKVVQRAPAGGTDFEGNPIHKTQGYKYRLNAPIAWDAEQVKLIRWRKPRQGRKRKKGGATGVDK
jgi:hypothetical protein